MDPTDLIAWASMLGLGVGLSAVVNWLIHKNESSAQVDSISVATAESVVDLVNRQLTTLKDEILKLELEIGLLRIQMKALATALHECGGNPDEVLADILDKTSYKRPH